MVTANANYDAILSTTLANYRDKLEDNISTRVALWWWLKEKDRVRTVSGGQKIVEQLLYALNPTGSSYSLYDTISLTPAGGITAAEYPWKQHAVTIAIAGLEEAQNAGDAQIIDLLQAKTKQAEMTAAEQFETMFMTSGTGNGAKDFLGITALVGDASSAVTTVGGIDASDATNSWWRSYCERTAGALTLAAMSTAYNSASRGPDSPNFAITTQLLYEKYEALLQPQQRFTDPKLGEAGFRNLMFKGGPIVISDAVLAGSVFFLNSTYLSLVKLGDNWLKNTPFVKPSNQDARFAQLLSYGNLTISNRKLGGAMLTGRTA